MCGQCGVLLGPNTNREAAWGLFTKLLLLNEKRGNQSTGIASIRPKGTKVLRGVMPAAAFVKDNKYPEYMNGGSFLWMGHCRFATSKPIDFDNAHPILSGQSVGTHNGYIWNDDALFKQFALPRQNVVDSELIIAAEDAGKLTEVLQKICGPVACALWNQRTREFKLVRVDNPLSVARRDGALFYSSEGVHLKEVGLEPESIPAETGWTFRGNEVEVWKAENDYEVGWSTRTRRYSSYGNDEYGRWYDQEDTTSRPNREKPNAGGREIDAIIERNRYDSPPKKATTLLFVYDDLRSGGLFDTDTDGFQSLGMGEVQGTLFDAEGEAIMALRGDGLVYGEVLLVDDKFIETMDRENHYMDRARVEVLTGEHSSMKAWAYVYPEGHNADLDAYRIIQDGDWLEASSGIRYVEDDRNATDAPSSQREGA